MTLGEGAKITHGEKVGSIIVHIKKEELELCLICNKFKIISKFISVLNIRYTTIEHLMET
jgi:hypothetical protein